MQRSSHNRDWWNLGTLEGDLGTRFILQFRFCPECVKLRVVLHPFNLVLAVGTCSTDRFHALTYQEIETMSESILKRLKRELHVKGQGTGKPDPASKKAFPGLVELLTETVDADGNPRELSSVTIKWQDGCWKAAIHEVGLEMSLWASVSTLEGCLLALEQRLVSDDADWRQWHKTGQAKGGRAKK